MFGEFSIQKLLFFLFLAYLLQMAFMFFQIKNYNKTMLAMKKLGIMGVGRKRGIFGGEVIMLISDSAGVITCAQRMKGSTVFTRFKDFSDFNNKTVYELSHKYADQKKRKHLVFASTQIINQLENKNDEDSLIQEED